MGTKESPSWWQGTVNPFPRAAVARPSTLRPDAPTIPTPAVEEMRQLIDEYVRGTLEAGDAAEKNDLPPNDGRVIVIDGDYGAGKTHLILEALGRVAEGRKAGLDPRPCYQVAPGGSMLLLYTEIMRTWVGPGEMLARVLEFYADIVADDLRGHPFAEQLVGELERDQVDPQLVVARYGLREGALLAALRDRLSSVTDNGEFSRALILLLQPELREIVWDWFTGGSPGQLLREQGLTKPIATDIQALEALGVLARLYRRKKRRFVLAVDEMEKLVLSWDSSDQGRAQAFKKLLEVFRRTGALLIMAGLPDIFEILPSETARVDAIIEPSGLKSENVLWYIKRTVKSLYGRDTAEPFTPESIDYMVYLTGGLARDVVRLCYFAYEYASATGKWIDREVINRAALTRSRRGAQEMVRNEIRQVLAEQARNPIEGWVFPDLPEVTVDFWVPVGDQGDGCAVLISNSLLDDHQADIAANRISLVRSSRSGRSVIQVVSGYLPADLRRTLEAALNGEPLIVYSSSSFNSEFTKSVNAVVSLIVGDAVESSQGGTELRMIREETDRLARQQATILRMLQESASREEQLFSAVQRALTTAAGVARPEPEDEAAELPAELAELFRAAQDSLTAYGDVQALVDDTFAIAADEPSIPYALVFRLRDPDAFNPVGVMTFLSTLLRGFQQNVRLWLGSLGPAGERGETPTAREREWLRGICQTYDALYGAAPVFKLDRLPEITSPPGVDQQFPRAGLTMRAESLHDAFDGLGDRVYETAIGLAGAGGGEPPRPKGR
jgi:hypothetical protein